MFATSLICRSFLLGSGASIAIATSAASQTTIEPADISSPFPLGEIVLRGEKLPRSLNDTVTSVTVVDGKTVANSGELGVFDVLEGAPNVLPQTAGSFITAVRGVDGTGPGFGFAAFLTGGRPRFTTFVDGVPQSVALGTPLQGFGTWNVDQVELFRGPQTTLQGRNAVAGVLHVSTLDPSFTPEFRLRVDSAIQPGEDGGFGRVAALATGAIIGDSVAGLLSFEATRGDSFIDFTSPMTPGFDVDQLQSYNLRGTLLFTPQSMPGLTARLTLSRFDEQAPLALTTGPGRFENTSGFNAVQQKIDGASLALDVTYDFDQGWSVQNVFTALSQNLKQFTDPNFFFQSALDVDTVEFSNDLRRIYEGSDGRTYFLLGAYAYTRDRDEVDPGTVALNARDKVENYALYSEGRFNFGGPFDFILGARYDHETQDRSGLLGPTNIGFSKTSSAFLPMAGVLYNHSEDMTFGATVRTGYLPGGSGASFITPGTFFIFGEEHVVTGELTFRGSFLDDRLRLSANAFYSQIDDYQLPSFIGGFLDSIVNVDEVTNYGLEVEAEAVVSDRLTVFGSLGLLESEIQSGLVNGANAAGQTLP